MKNYNIVIVILAFLLVGLFAYAIFFRTELPNLTVPEEIDYIIDVDDDCSIETLKETLEGKNNVLKFTDNSDSGRAKYTKTFSEKTTGTIKFSLFIDVNNKKTMYISLKSNLDYAVKIYISHLNKIRYYYDDEWHTLKRYNVDTWIEFEIEFSTYIDRYTLKIDGEKELENKMFYEKDDLVSVDTLIFETIKSSKDYHVYLADLSIS